MQPTTNVIERAYQLARSGSCRSVSDIIRALQRERFSSVDQHMSGSSIRKELNALCRSAGSASRPPPEQA